MHHEEGITEPVIRINGKKKSGFRSPEEKPEREWIPGYKKTDWFAIFQEEEKAEQKPVALSDNLPEDDLLLEAALLYVRDAFTDGTFFDVLDLLGLNERGFTNTLLGLPDNHIAKKTYGEYLAENKSITYIEIEGRLHQLFERIADTMPLSMTINDYFKTRRKETDGKGDHERYDRNADGTGGTDTKSH